MTDFFMLAAGVFLAVVGFRVLTHHWARLEDSDEHPDTDA
ncbi:hypothetical protein SAMN05444004_12243 [Jannaschia faecimaris]|uniref:Uncharacterized protein n=1 Tax=Jannaschia faecimaris TaxID=1244108 RepID=A0A1H3U394_9RHOB|nr:hypothetical protein SAMN05444004_12243 [Jannaschia faecimaris]